ncbi:unnamed protein product [Malus baccata var. baccata]
MCVRELEQKLTHACGFIGVRPSNDCKTELIVTSPWSLLKPETLQPLPWKQEGLRSVSLTMPKKMQTSYHADLVPAKGNVVTDRSVGNTVDGEPSASIDKNGTSFQEPRSVNLGGPQGRLIPEMSPAEDEPAANFALCVSSLNAAQVLDQVELISALLNGC